MVLLKLDRSDYDRLNNLLGHVAALDGRSFDGEHAAAAPGVIGQITAVMPPAEARRLCAETDRQAQES
jgi:hypothetical protein